MNRKKSFTIVFSLVVVVTGVVLVAAGIISTTVFFVVVALIGCIVVLLVTLCCFLRKRKSRNDNNIEAGLKDCGLSALKRYKYKDVKKMANSFNDKIGQGGFGSVFKGMLPDGHMVAVKILNETKGDGNEFINEVASISRTSHVNIVTLQGFCVQGPKRALIYEFMQNGSLEKFIYEKTPEIRLKKKKKKKTPERIHQRLGWETLYKIAVGIARGLEYLHRGCNTRILHFDIKPHNILLDEDFNPKIADFGLSKLCHVKESIVSMTRPRGTPGYIAPEVVSRNFGVVSHKSDVYSYGMMVLEMVGGRRNLDTGVTDLSEIYFPIWVYKRLNLNEGLGLHGITSEESLNLNEGLGLHGITSEEDQEIAKKMILVGLWCIQIHPQNRPPMSRVLEMLAGSLESLQIPPNPFPPPGQEQEQEG